MKRASLFCLLILSGCDRGPSPGELAARNRALAAAADPAITAALEDPIMTDRELSVADDSRRVRHVGGPAQAIYPPRSKANEVALAGLAGLAAPNGCERGFVYDKSWAQRLPQAFAPLPGATLVEAAGNARCRSRFVGLRSSAAPAAILGWYSARVVAAGYTATARARGADRILTGARAGDGAGYYLVVSPRTSNGARSSEIALLTTGG